MRARISRTLLDTISGLTMNELNASDISSSREDWKERLRTLPSKHHMLIFTSEPLDAGTDEGLLAILVSMDAIFRRFDRTEAPLLTKENVPLNNTPQLQDECRSANDSPLCYTNSKFSFMRTLQPTETIHSAETSSPEKTITTVESSDNRPKASRIPIRTRSTKPSSRKSSPPTATLLQTTLPNKENIRRPRIKSLVHDVKSPSETGDHASKSPRHAKLYIHSSKIRTTKRRLTHRQGPTTSPRTCTLKG